MAGPAPVEPVLRLVALLWSQEQARERAVTELEHLFGAISHQGPDHPFEVTDYYREEMGPGLRRRLLAFAELVPPEGLVADKLACNAIEQRLAVGGRRLVNLDVGYLDHSKVVLGSMKFAGQKIHLGRGVWADPILRWEAGAWRPFPWTFPDFRDGRYQAELRRLRRDYLEKLRAWRRRRQEPPPL